MIHVIFSLLLIICKPTLFNTFICIILHCGDTIQLCVVLLCIHYDDIHGHVCRRMSYVK